MVNEQAVSEKSEPVLDVEERRAVDSIATASILYQELFKKLILSNSPSEVGTKTRMDIVMALRVHGPQSMSSLSAKTCIAPEQVTRTVKALREDGLVSCERDQENRRSVVVSLTDAGCSTLSRHRNGVAEDVLSYLDTLTEEDRVALVDAAEVSVRILHSNGSFGPCVTPMFH